MQELFNLFESMDYPYFRQGSLSDENYPNSFFTFWNYATPNQEFYDNDAKTYVEYVMVYFYTNEASKIYSVMNDFITLAKQNNIKVEGRAYDTPADKDNYFGRLVRIKIIHKEE